MVIRQRAPNYPLEHQAVLCAVPFGLHCSLLFEDRPLNGISYHRIGAMTQANCLFHMSVNSKNALQLRVGIELTKRPLKACWISVSLIKKMLN